MQQFETIFGLDSWRGTGVSSEVTENSVITRGAPGILQVHMIKSIPSSLQGDVISTRPFSLGFSWAE